jgi:biopolymer transport protein ExbD
MIDIVFLLIFFFMVVTDLQKMEIEEIDLPFAVEATPETDTPPKRVIVNVKPHGEVGIMGWTFDSEGLFEFLRRAAADGPHDETTGLPELAVKIRADKVVEYEKVQDVMVQCMRSRLWKVSFGTQPELDEKGLMLSPEFE